MAALKSVGKGTPASTFMASLLMLRNRQLFNTEEGGKFGFTIQGVLPGDAVCAFNNASTLHVLRRVADRAGEVYRAIGDAYVHGLMNGEADNTNFKEQDVTPI
jgi:hypothetical protein